MNDMNEGRAEDQATENIEVDELDTTVPQKSRFSSLTMKEKVKTRGRPKRKTKQLTFNKTAADKKSLNKIKKPRRRVVREDFIEDSTEEEEPVLDDNSDDSLYDEEDNDDPTNLDSTVENEVFFNNNVNI